MTVVFDKENAISFFKQIDDSDIGEDIINLLKRQLSLQFNFELDNIDEALEFQILEFIEAGGRIERGLTISFKNGKDYTEPFCLENITKNNDVFLLESITNKVKKSNKVYSGTIGEEIDILSKLFLNKNDLSTHESITIGSDSFKSWRDIERYSTPFSTLLVVDRYMFKGSETGGNLGMFDYNLKEIIATLFKNINHRANLIFIYQINISVPLTNLQYDEGPDQVKLRQKVKNATKIYNKYCPEPNISFVAVPKGQIKDEHDRYIISDYIKIKSGDSIVYFDSQSNIISNSNDFDIYSLAKKQYESTTKNLVVKLNSTVNETLRTFKRRCLLHDDTITSNLISF